MAKRGRHIKWNLDYIVLQMLNIYEKYNGDFTNLSRKNKDLFEALKRSGYNLNNIIDIMDGRNDLHLCWTQKLIIKDSIQKGYNKRLKPKTLDEAELYFMGLLDANKTIKEIIKNEKDLYNYINKNIGIIKFLDKIYGCSYNYSNIFEMKIPSEFWNSERKKQIILDYLKCNNDLSNFKRNFKQFTSAFCNLNNFIGFCRSIKIGESKINLIKLKEAKGYWRRWKNVKRHIDEGIARWQYKSNTHKMPTFTLQFFFEYCEIPKYVIPQYHGGVGNVIKRMGYEDNRKKALSGNICLSADEILVDDFLTINSAKHDNSKIISSIDGKTINPDNIFIGKDGKEKYVEVWSHRKGVYQDRKGDKQRIYREKNLTLIEFEYHELLGSYQRKINMLKKKFKDHIDLKFSDYDLMSELFKNFKKEIEMIRRWQRSINPNFKKLYTIPELKRIMKEDPINNEACEKLIKLLNKIGNRNIIKKYLGISISENEENTQTDHDKKSIGFRNKFLCSFESMHFILLQCKIPDETIRQENGTFNILSIVKILAKNIEESDDIVCPYCGSTDINLGGKNNNKTFNRYYCKNEKCSLKRFSSTSLAKYKIVHLIEKCINISDNPQDRQELGRILDYLKEIKNVK